VSDVKHIGIVAVSYEGAALCYRTICNEGRDHLGPFQHPEVSLHGFSLSEYHQHSNAGDWAGVGELLLRSAERLAVAGAELLVCPDNTVHAGIDLVLERASLPWLHIAEEVARAAEAAGYQRLGLLGTRPLMEGPVYPRKLEPKGIRWLTPEADARQRLHRYIVDELIYGVITEEAHTYFQSLIVGLADQGCEAVILGCTEIPLLIRPADSVLPTLDSTRLLARAALREATR
jgi:aspartate racemase